MPQDVEADDKLIGPFSFRQFVYLLIAGGLIALAAGLFQLFPLLALIPVPPTLLFLALALPLKKDQPMETYLAAIVSYYLKPRTRRWVTGQKESTILITAPKKIEEVRTRNLSQEEATHRLSFLADIVDSEGYAIKGAANNNMREDLVAEANATADMFENYNAANLGRAIAAEQQERHAEAIDKMRAAIDRNETFLGMQPSPSAPSEVHTDATGGAGAPAASVIVQASSGDTSAHQQTSAQASSEATVPRPATVAEQPKEELSPKQKNDIMELASNSDFSVATIAKEANRINRKDDGEIFISLH